MNKRREFDLNSADELNLGISILFQDTFAHLGIREVGYENRPRKYPFYLCYPPEIVPGIEVPGRDEERGGGDNLGKVIIQYRETTDIPGEEVLAAIHKKDRFR